MSYLQRTLEQAETVDRVDGPARLLQRRLRRVFPDERPAARVLSGSWLGHPLHPALVLAPAGAWIAAGVLDLVPGQQRAARKLVLAGLAFAPPAGVAGAVDFRNLDQRQRRVGLWHLLSNTAATVCYATSYRRRRRGQFLSGRVWALAGLAAVSTGGLLGGHLTYAQGVGVYRWQPERGTQPARPAHEPADAAAPEPQAAQQLAGPAGAGRG